MLFNVKQKSLYSKGNFHPKRDFALRRVANISKNQPFFENTISGYSTTIFIKKRRFHISDK